MTTRTLVVLVLLVASLALSGCVIAPYPGYGYGGYRYGGYGHNHGYWWGY